MTYIKFHGVSFGYTPDRLILRDINLTLTHGIYAIAGPNGAGKTTLLNLVANALQPGGGQLVLSPSASCAFLPQATIAGRCNRLSSGENKMQLLRGVLQQAPQILLLDEPETHLDTAHRRWLVKHLATRNQLVLMVSHDGELLNLATRILHVENQVVTVFDSGYAAYREKLAQVRQAAVNAASRAQRIAQSEARHLQQTLERQQKRSLNAARRAPDSGIPRIALGLMKRNAEKTSGSLAAHAKKRMGELEAKIRQARAEVAPRLDLRFEGQWHKRLRGLARLEVTELQFYAEPGQRLWRHPLSFVATSGDRVRIKGPNGAGKSVLIRHLCGAREFHSSGSFARSGHSDLVLAGATANINEHRNLLQLAKERLPDLTEGELRRQLGAYGYRGEKVFEPQANLSAGEKIRLQILLATGADTAPGFCFFDEAEVGLDFETRLAVAEFLRSFEGIVMFATHDELFAQHLSPTLEVMLERA
jgi:ATPase subunit of ABC transporter with duplicated ATPase domains